LTSIVHRIDELQDNPKPAAIRCEPTPAVRTSNRIRAEQLDAGFLQTVHFLQDIINLDRDMFQSRDISLAESPLSDYGVVNLQKLDIRLTAAVES